VYGPASPIVEAAAFYVGIYMKTLTKALLGAALVVAIPTAGNAAAVFKLEISTTSGMDKALFKLSNLSTAGETIEKFSLAYALVSPNVIIDAVSFSSPNDVDTYEPSNNSNGLGLKGLSIVFDTGAFTAGEVFSFNAEFDVSGTNQSPNDVDWRTVLFSNNATSTVTFSTGATTFDLGTHGLQSTYVYPSTTAAVPEPATWGLMIGGFAMMGGALRSRKRNAFATA
jgi:hypothetical protein